MANIPFNQVSPDARRALEDFSMEFEAALAVVPPEELWARNLGVYLASDAIKTTFPVPISAAGYQKFEGDQRMRSLYQRSLECKPELWQDGVQEFARIIEAPDFIGWLQEPARMATEAARHGNTITAAMLEANPNLDFYKDPENGITTARALFAADHPFNIFDPDSGTFDNDNTGTAIDAALVKAVKQRFRQRKGPNGKPLGLRVTHCMVPAPREEEARDFFERDMLIESVENAALDSISAVTQRNRHQGVSLIVADELTNDDVIYFLDARPNAPKPWVLQEGSTEDIMFDKDSDYYKQTLKVGLSKIMAAAAAAAMPHAIERITLS